VLTDQHAQDGDDLLRRLAGTEDGLGAAGPQRAMEVDLREAEVVVWKPPQALERVLGLDAATRDRLEQVAEPIAVHHR
jgi:hypothetical protein